MSHIRQNERVLFKFFDGIRIKRMIFKVCLAFLVWGNHGREISKDNLRCII